MFLLPWYYLVAIAVGGVVVLSVFIFIIYKCCCKKDSKKGSYIEIKSVEVAEEQEEVRNVNTNSSYTVRKGDHDENADASYQILRKHGNVTNVNETTAEIACSDIDIEMSGTVSAYGDTASMVSVASKASWLTMETVSNLNLSVQASLIYANEMKYVAGKIIQVEGLTFGKHAPPTHARIHVVVLPVKKYALKTNWYEISNDKVRIEEYFKYVFKLPPSDTRTMFRIRVYGRKMKVGTLGKASCMGECYINLMEIINSRGGLTVWRTLSRGIPQSILEGHVN